MHKFLLTKQILLNEQVDDEDDDVDKVFSGEDNKEEDDLDKAFSGPPPKQSEPALGKKRGEYTNKSGARKRVDIVIGTGNKYKQEIVNNAWKELQQSSGSPRNMDKKRAFEHFNDFMAAVGFNRFATINMWPKDDNAILIVSGMQSSLEHAIEASSIIGNTVYPSNDLCKIFLSKEFTKLLIKSLQEFGLIGFIEKKKKVHYNVPKDQLTKDEKEIEYDETKDQFFVSGEEYSSGNVSLKFVEEIKAKDLKDFLDFEGWNVTGKEEEEDE